MKFGQTLPSFTWPGLDYQTTRRITKEMARRAEELGFDSLTVWDHLLSAPGLYGGSWLDLLMVLSGAAGVTETIPLDTHILVAPIRHPVLLAKELATLDYMSGGRFFLGVGPGWNEPEFTAMGVSFHGAFFQFDDVTIEPRPARYFTVWVAGGSRIPDALSPDKPYMVKTVLQRIAKHADVFTCRASGKAEWVVRDFSVVKDYLRSVGRDPATLGLAHVQAGYVVDTADRAKALERQRQPMETLMGTHRSWEHLRECYLLGSIDDIVERLQFLESHGLEHVTIHPAAPETEQLDLWMEKIIRPYFR